MRNSKFKIPPSLLKHLSEVPKDAPVAILLRHSVRNSLPSGKEAYLFPITKVGMSLAQELGAFLGGRLRSIRSSPLHRCVQTGEHLAQGAGIQIQVLKSHLLGDPGPFVNDGAMASTNWESLGHNKVMDSISASEQILPGMADGDFAARFTAKRLLSDISDNYGFHIFVTHDSVIGATVSRLCGENLKQEDWPHFLEAAFHMV
ncbi:MAG: histidine phosphatase family protein [Planctomycetota bacterium]|nr:histidine phosphatase family protein [Planctomycetota bacterium]